MAAMPLTARELRRGDFDVVHAFHFTDGALAARSGRPAVYSVMGVIEPRAIANKRRKLGLIQEATRGTTVLALSDAAAGSVWRWLGVRARTIYPGLDLRAFPAGARAAEPTIFCAAAIDDERKRVGLLVEAFARLRTQRPDARLVLIRGRKTIEADGVTLIDPVDNPASLYGSAWVSALPSRAEAFGMVVVESLACGTPVVAARDGALPELIDRPEVGELFDGDDPAALAAALATALDRTAASNGSIAAACRARAGDFSVARSADAHEALYRELIG
jgi:glycosyltransferase involved in cell wall biosynthesis